MAFKPKKRKLDESIEKLKKISQESEEEDYDDEEEDEEELEVPTPKSHLNKRSVNKVVQKKQVEVVENTWSAEEIPTSTQTVIYNSKEDRTYSIMEALAELLNRTEE